MADTKISALPAGTTIAGTEPFPAVQGGITVQLTAAQIKTFTSLSPTLVTPVIGVATGTSLALGGATIGTDALGVTGTATYAGNATYAAANSLTWTSRGKLDWSATDTIRFTNAAGTASFTINIGSTGFATFGGPIATNGSGIFISSGNRIQLDFGATNNYNVSKQGTATRLTTGGTVEFSDSTGTNVVSITPGANGLASFGGPINTLSTVVASLPAAGTAGRRAFVTDALTPAFGAAVVGGGAVKVPVYDTGSAWAVG